MPVRHQHRPGVSTLALDLDPDRRWCGDMRYNADAQPLALK